MKNKKVLKKHGANTRNLISCLWNENFWGAPQMSECSPPYPIANIIVIDTIVWDIIVYNIRVFRIASQGDRIFGITVSDYSHTSGERPNKHQR